MAVTSRNWPKAFRFRPRFPSDRVVIVRGQVRTTRSGRTGASEMGKALKRRGKYRESKSNPRLWMECVEKEMLVSSLGAWTLQMELADPGDRTVPGTSWNIECRRRSRQCRTRSRSHQIGPIGRAMATCSSPGKGACSEHGCTSERARRAQEAHRSARHEIRAASSPRRGDSMGRKPVLGRLLPTA